MRTGRERLTYWLFVERDEAKEWTRRCVRTEERNATTRIWGLSPVFRGERENQLRGWLKSYRHRLPVRAAKVQLKLLMIVIGNPDSLPQIVYFLRFRSSLKTIASANSFMDLRLWRLSRCSVR